MADLAADNDSDVTLSLGLEADREDDKDLTMVSFCLWRQPAILQDALAIRRYRHRC
jgi:hypothetical protein